MEDETSSENRNDSPPSANLIDLDPKPKPKRKKKKKNKPAKPAEPQMEPVYIRDEVEFAKDDYDGRIQRYEERIRDGFCRITFEKKIERTKAAKERALAMAPYGEYDVTFRIGDLQRKEESLIKAQDPDKQLSNVQAVRAAYENGDLLYDGKTTYWCQGKKIAGPSVFSEEDFARYNTEENRGDGGFWVEKAKGPPRGRPLSLPGFHVCRS